MTIKKVIHKFRMFLGKEERGKDEPQTIDPQFPNEFYAEIDSHWDRYSPNEVAYEIIGKPDMESFRVEWGKSKKIAVYRLVRMMELSSPPQIKDITAYHTSSFQERTKEEQSYRA